MKYSEPVSRITGLGLASSICRTPCSSSVLWSTTIVETNNPRSLQAPQGI
ncbi:uncharacterized protein Bfra_006680 [Botrytis fragariae]|uniref:Uncharacterized protein n=1 Tax=Botrytis fragariae TaxID=1964551 RepID=A0A8H6B5R4_9HELO|nr:uncharacterized protein Bfra_006680 [Botrytis fragariae]KAF5879472.1 hypothetical protein Bfra_006680 [Botrytis fragariae]